MQIKGIEQMEKRKDQSPACYLINLLKAIDINSYAGTEFDYENISKDQMTGLKYAVSCMQEKEQKIVKYRYKDGMCFRAIGEKLGISGTRAVQLHNRVLWELRNPPKNSWYVEGYEAYMTRHEMEMEAARQFGQNKNGPGMEEMPVDSCRDELGMNNRMLNSLHRYGLGTIGKLRGAMQEPHWNASVRGIGDKSADMLVCRMMELGLIDETYEAVKEYKWKNEKKESYIDV